MLKYPHQVSFRGFCLLAHDEESRGDRISRARFLAALGMTISLSAFYDPPGFLAESPALLGVRDSVRFTPFVPTPYRVVEKMLELAQVGRDDTVYDLGSGDGRVVIAAAQKFGARAVGVEIRSELAERSTQEIAQLGLQKRARIIHGDMFETDEIVHATVVTLYQLTAVNNRLRPLLEKRLRPGTRVVACDFQVPGWTFEKVVTVTSENGNEYKLFLYIRP